MDVDFESRHLSIHSSASLDILLNDNQSSEWINALIAVKNDIIGSDREKLLTLQSGVVSRLLKWIEDETVSHDIKTEAVTVLGSLAKGNAEIIKILVQEKTVPTLLKSMTHLNLQYTEAILRCLRSIFLVNSDYIPNMYEENRFGRSYIPHLLSLLKYSAVCQECIATILGQCCLTTDHQMELLESDAINSLAPLLVSDVYKVQMPTLKCFASMCYRNTAVCLSIGSVPNLIQVFVELMGRDKPSEMQLASAKVLTYLHRGGAIEATDPIINRKTLGTLVRMCKRDRPLEENVKGAETLAYLIEVDPDLQMTASVTDHLISTLANYIHYKDVKKVSSDKKEVDWGSEMRRAAFLAFAAISANDEEIRDKVVKKEGLLNQVMACLHSTNTAEVAASLRCLQSLTRSVRQIRTALHDNAVWKPLIEMLQSKNKEIKVLAMTCLCNLVLDFSPCREYYPERHWSHWKDIEKWRSVLHGSAIEIFGEYCRSDDNTVRLNAIWAMMSLSYSANHFLRMRIIENIGIDCLKNIIKDPVMVIRQKALGVVRNLLTSLNEEDEREYRGRAEYGLDKTVIDQMVKLLGSDVIDAVFSIVTNPNVPVYVLEQALCVVSNMADGPSCKAHVIGKTEVLQSVFKYLDTETCSDPRLQMPVVQMVNNMLAPSDDGAYQRMLVLKDLRVHKMLQDLLTKTDNTSQLHQFINSALENFT